MEYRSGYIPFHGYQTFYEIFGKTEPGKYPLLLLHGGPGIPHEYIVSMKGIAESGRACIFYDQIGCGKSIADLDPSEYTEDLLADEVDAVREALGLDEIHLLGQSCGGMLAQLPERDYPGARALTSRDRVPALPIRPVDTTGAGDAFLAGFVSAWLKGYDIPSCAAIGSAQSYSVLDAVGANVSAGTWSDALNVLAQNHIELQFRTGEGQ